MAEPYTPVTVRSGAVSPESEAIRREYVVGDAPTPQMPRSRDPAMRISESASRHMSYNVLMDQQLEELRSMAGGDVDVDDQEQAPSPSLRSVATPADQSSLYRAYRAPSRAGSTADLLQAPSLLPMPSQQHLPLSPGPPSMVDLNGVPVIRVSAAPGSGLIPVASSASMPALGMPNAYSNASLGLMGMATMPAAPIPAYTPPPPAVRSAYASTRREEEDDYYEDDEYEGSAAYGAPPVVDMYSEGMPTPVMRHSRRHRERERDRPSSSRTRHTNPGTDRTAVAEYGDRYLASPTGTAPYPPSSYGGGHSRSAYAIPPATPGTRSAAVAPDESVDGTRAARYYYKQPPRKHVAWWRRSLCHFIGLAMAALCGMWLLNWIFAGMSWALRPRQISLVVGIEPQTSDASYQLVNYTLVSPIDSMLASALAVDYVYGATRDQVVAMVANENRYVGFFVSKDYTSTLLGRSVPAVVEFVHDSGKNYKTVRDLLFSMILFNEKLRVAIATEFVKQNVSASVGYWLTGPVRLSYTDIHPVATEGQNIFAYMTTFLLWIGCIFIATIASWMTHPEAHRRGTEFGWRFGATAGMLALLTLGTTLIPLMLNGQFAGASSSAAGWASTWGWMVFLGTSYLGTISLAYQLAGRDLGQALMLVFGFIQFGMSWSFLDQNLSFLGYQIGKAFPMYWSVYILRNIYFGSNTAYVGIAVAVVFSWTLATCSLAILMWFMGWNRVGQTMQRFFSEKVWLGDPRILGLDEDDRTEDYEKDRARGAARY